ncbi:MAG: DUF1963 domain-containing protein [Solirubrobacteraceae bacterium]|nr:DUF1963 domain-containing protein [Solirubrobacteraceae bacterium]
MGGRARLPRGMRWPRTPKGKVPLSFVATIDLAQAGAFAPLPTDGTLTVFYDGGSSDEFSDLRGTTSVTWSEAGTRFRAVGNPWRGRSPEWHDRKPQYVAGLPMPIAGEAQNVADELGEEPGWDHLVGTMNTLVSTVLPTGNQLLGASRDVQYRPVVAEIPYWLREAPRRTRRAYSAGERAGRGWIMLAQFYGTEDMSFGDAGALNLVIPKVDLEKRRFDRVLGILQSH